MTTTRLEGPSSPDPAARHSTRRRFLQNAAGAAGAAAFIAPLSGLAWRTPEPSGARPNWAQLQRNLTGKLLLPDGADAESYAEAIKIWNLRYAPTRPGGVALVAHAGDIATAIAWARDNGVEMVTRSGGHNYAGYSTTPGLVINLSGMTKVTFDGRTNLLTTHGAAKNQDVVVAGRPVGRSIPGGQCPTVGVSGFVLGGGLGFHMRQHGLGIDSLLATEMVTAAGELIQASATEHPDLFWALRGGAGGNFGINTSFTFRTFAVPARVTTFSLTWEGEACIKAFLAFQEALLGAPDALAAIADFSAERHEDGSLLPILEVVGQLVDSKEATEAFFAPVVAAAAPTATEIDVRSFWGAKAWLSESTNAPKAFAERSRFHPKPLPEAGVEAIVDALSKAPIGREGQRVESSFFAWGGAVAHVHPTATAFIHRHDVWLQSFHCAWNVDDSNEAIERLIAWQDDLYDVIGAFASDRAFQNFPDPQLERPLDAYYGENLARLIQVKRAYDPGNTFTFAQAIG